MSRNSKSARRVAARQAVTAMHKSGQKGPKQTTPKHGKVHRAPRNKIAIKPETKET